MKEITIVAKNEVGSLATVSEALGNIGVNIDAISAYAQDNKAVFRILTKDAVTAIKTLSRIPNMSITESDIILLRMQNRPGELGKITRKLSNNTVNLESVYIVSKASDFTEVAIRPSNSDFEKAKTVLKIR